MQPIPPALIAGPHVDRGRSARVRAPLSEHIERARRAAETEAGFEIRAASVFVGGPHARTITLSEPERALMRDYVGRTGIRVIAHNTYNASPWKGDPTAAAFIREELAVCREAGIDGLVVHLPLLPADRVLHYLPRLADPAPAAGAVVAAAEASPRIFLETPAVTPRETYYEAPEKLVSLFESIYRDVDPARRQFGLCVDTAHLWTSGVDLSSYDLATDWLDGLDGAIPPGGLMFHLNDSERPRGVGPDAHAGLAQGRIWSEYRDDVARSGIAAFVEYAERHEIPVILERKPAEALRSDYLLLRQL